MDSDARDGELGYEADEYDERPHGQKQPTEPAGLEVLPQGHPAPDPVEHLELFDEVVQSYRYYGAAVYAGAQYRQSCEGTGIC